MKTLRIVLILSLSVCIFSNCQKETIQVEEPEITEPVVEDEVVEEPVDISECQLKSVLLRDKVLITLEYSQNKIRRIKLSEQGQIIADGTFLRENGLDLFTWKTEDGTLLGESVLNRFGKPLSQTFTNVEGTKSTSRTFIYDSFSDLDVLVKIEETNEETGDFTETFFLYIIDQLEKIIVVKNGRARPDKGKEFIDFDSNPNPFAPIGLLLLDFPEFFNNMFWPCKNNPLRIDEKIKGSISYEYEYNELGFPVDATYSFRFNDSDISNNQSSEYECD